ncbi:MAG: hypothetical protein M1336_02740 [Deltaproteobacteria bacterium]|nr:hypothetical protein [Deltaproteobacteria bacterium]
MTDRTSDNATPPGHIVEALDRLRDAVLLVGMATAALIALRASTHDRKYARDLQLPEVVKALIKEAKRHNLI